jgi:hypothetical protein
VVIHKIDIGCIVAPELEHQSPISRHRNRPLPGALTLQLAGTLHLSKREGGELREFRAAAVLVL